jgi:hypothetical protein
MRACDKGAADSQACQDKQKYEAEYAKNKKTTEAAIATCKADPVDCPDDVRASVNNLWKFKECSKTPDQPDCMQLAQYRKELKEIFTTEVKNARAYHSTPKLGTPEQREGWANYLDGFADDASRVAAIANACTAKSLSPYCAGTAIWYNGLSGGAAILSMVLRPDVGKGMIEKPLDFYVVDPLKKIYPTYAPAINEASIMFNNSKPKIDLENQINQDADKLVEQLKNKPKEGDKK